MQSKRWISKSRIPVSLGANVIALNAALWGDILKTGSFMAQLDKDEEDLKKFNFVS